MMESMEIGKAEKREPVTMHQGCQDAAFPLVRGSSITELALASVLENPL